MKSLEELAALREEMSAKIITREKTGTVRVLVGMATCGMAAGATPVFEALKKEIADKGITGADVIATGCIGICQYEPVVEIDAPGKDKVTYVKMDAEKAARVVAEHLAGGKVVTEYTIGAFAK